jgi:putative Mg2+ transporter-C (MgtC) family protein
MLVTLGSCLFTILSIEAFPVKGTAQDTARIAAQIVTGVGFLGAGALFQSHGQVKGLTTAATIGMVAAVGMACGTGMYFLAVFSTLLTEAVLVVLKPISDRLAEGRRNKRRRVQKKPTGIAQRTPAGYHEVPKDELDDDD